MQSKNLKIKSFRIRLKKKKANCNAEYSVLNPDTNSLSPSAKSKGARFNSATHLIIQISNKGKTNKKYFFEFFENKFKFKVISKQQGIRINKIKLIS